MTLAYIAGFFDGEGCVGFVRARSAIYARVLVTNTDRAVLEKLQQQFGGDIRQLALRRSGWKTGWYWRLSWSRAVAFLDAIYPWLRVKRAQAQTIFAWDAIRVGRGKQSAADRAAYLDAVELLRVRMHWLNKKGGSEQPDPIDET
jgi:hypothetical protein